MYFSTKNFHITRHKSIGLLNGSISTVLLSIPPRRGQMRCFKSSPDVFSLLRKNDDVCQYLMRNPNSEFTFVTMEKNLSISQDKTAAELPDAAEGNVLLGIDKEAERSYVRKLDLWLLPFLSVCYFFSAVDRVWNHSHRRLDAIIC